MVLPEKIYKTDEVFGISRDQPLNYIERPEVDGRFVENLTRAKHLVIYGSSKQGKSSLRKHWLNEEQNYISVHCSNRWNIADLHVAILKRAGYEVTQSNTKTTAGKNKINASGTLSIFGNGLGGGAETGREKTEATVRTPLELDPDDVNDIITALKSLEKYVVLEDFHYLSTETQQDFAVALKAFHEQSHLTFIIIGVW